MAHMPKLSTSILALGILVANAGDLAAQGLPGGATSLSETHGAWTVACRTAVGAVRC